MQETHEIQVPSLGREDASGVGNGNLLQYSCQENPMERGAWSGVHGITKSWTWMSDWAHICVTRDNLQTVAHLTCVTCNGFSLVSKWNWRWKACQYFKEILLSLSNMFWRSLTWKGLFWMRRSVLWLSDVWLFATPWTAAHQASLSITNSRMLCKLMSIESVMPSSHLILCRPLLLPPWIFPRIRVFSNKLVLHIRLPKYWSFASASVLAMNIQDWLPLGLTSWISLQFLP